MEFAKGYSFVSEDGVIIRLDETPERERIILSLSRNGKVETASLNHDMFKELCGLKYDLQVHEPAKDKVEVES